MTDRLTVDKPYNQQPETRAAAARYIVRKRDDHAELLMALGLARDPLAVAKSRAKAMADLGKSRPARGGR